MFLCAKLLWETILAQVGFGVVSYKGMFGTILNSIVECRFLMLWFKKPQVMLYAVLNDDYENTTLETWIEFWRKGLIVNNRIMIIHGINDKFPKWLMTWLNSHEWVLMRINVDGKKLGKDLSVSFGRSNSSLDLVLGWLFGFSKIGVWQICLSKSVTKINGGT